MAKLKLVPQWLLENNNNDKCDVSSNWESNKEYLSDFVSPCYDENREYINWRVAENNLEDELSDEEILAKIRYKSVKRMRKYGRYIDLTKEISKHKELLTAKKKNITVAGKKWCEDVTVELEEEEYDDNSHINSDYDYYDYNDYNDYNEYNDYDNDNYNDRGNDYLD